MIRLQGVSKRYRARGDSLQPPVLRAIDLEIDAGEVVFISGATGAGKTTLLGLLYAAHLPDEGSVEIFGRNLTRLRHTSLALLRRHMGIVPQELTLLEERTALANVALALEVCAVPERQMRTRAVDALGRVGLALETDTPVRELSSGQRQLVALARAIVREPDILIADEPSTHLDSAGRETLIELIAAASQDGRATVAATQDRTLLSMGAHHGWRHIELHEGALRVIADRDAARPVTHTDVEDEYETYEIEVEDNVVRFPVAAHAGGLFE